MTSKLIINFSLFILFQSFSAIAAIGNFLLVGTTTNSFKNLKYISFKDKSGMEYKIPRQILSSKENSNLATGSVVLFKEISPEKYLAYRESCEKDFAKEIEKHDSQKKRKPASNESKRPCL